jgi:CheY-like chemotaxis protein
MKGKSDRILLVEDNSADIYLVRKALDGAGLAYDLTAIEDGADAMDFVRATAKYAGRAVPDLAILDMSLPKNDGLQILEAIRADAAFASMPVIVMSSSARPPSHLKLDQLQVMRYIPKPPDLDDFLRIGLVIRDVLESRARHAGRMPNETTENDDRALRRNEAGFSACPE